MDGMYDCHSVAAMNSAELAAIVGTGLAFVLTSWSYYESEDDIQICADRSLTDPLT